MNNVDEKGTSASQTYDKAQTDSILANASKQTEAADDLHARIDQTLANMRATQAALWKLSGSREKFPEDYEEKPRVMTPEDAAALMVGKKRVALLTGAGISAASGIPTFRGSGGFWTSDNAGKYAGVDDPEEICTKPFFREHPEALWQWHVDFLKILDKPEVRPNAGHMAIKEFQEYCALSQGAQKVECFLGTQNIDNLHTELIKGSDILMSSRDEYFDYEADNAQTFTPHCYDIHGNVLYMHCSDEEEEHAEILFEGPSLSAFEEFKEKVRAEEGEEAAQKRTLVPVCSTCGKDMKPHCMFFDEMYSEHYYRAQTVRRFYE